MAVAGAALAARCLEAVVELLLNVAVLLLCMLCNAGRAVRQRGWRLCSTLRSVSARSWARRTSMHGRECRCSDSYAQQSRRDNRNIVMQSASARC